MHTLPFLSRRENIARYEQGQVYILDRRVYPFEVTYVKCPTYEDVAVAIEKMVTQSLGPGLVASYGMVLAARHCNKASKEAIFAELEKAAKRLINTRPTANFIYYEVVHLLEIAKKALEQGENIELALLDEIDQRQADKEKTYQSLGLHGASLINDGDSILNQCWADSYIVYTILAALKQGKKIEAYCCETRPYLQGARLTADALGEMGVPTTVITDNMPAYLLSKGKISKFYAGADRVTMDGHVINKIGTLQIAICAHQYNVPFYALNLGPDRKTATPNDLTIEERDPEEVLHCLGIRTATNRAKGYYPAFDVTPPKFVSALVTDRGIFSPFAAADYYHLDTENS